MKADVCSSAAHSLSDTLCTKAIHSCCMSVGHCVSVCFHQIDGGQTYPCKQSQHLNPQKVWNDAVISHSLYLLSSVGPNGEGLFQIDPVYTRMSEVTPLRIHKPDH